MGNPRDTSIYVRVDICDINEGNKNDKVRFSDNRGGGSGPGNQFKSKVNRGKKIHLIGIGWCSNGKGRDVDVPVAITKISIKEEDHDSEILWYNEYLDNGTGEVIGAIKQDNTSATITENYSVTIRVNGNEYVIDPQLEMIP